MPVTLLERETEQLAEAAEFVGTQGLPPLPSRDKRREQMSELLAEMDVWLADESGFDKSIYGALLAGLQRHPVTFGQP